MGLGEPIRVVRSTPTGRMSEEGLHGALVASLTIDLGGLRAPHRVCAIRGRL